MNSERSTVANVVVKQHKTIKASIMRGSHPTTLLNLLLDGAWQIAILEAEEATERLKQTTKAKKK